MSSPTPDRPRDQVLMRFVAGIARVRSSLSQRGLLTVALVLFIGAFAYGLANLPDVEAETRWWLLAITLFVGVPATVLFNAVEYVIMARIAGYSVTFWPALEVSVLASAANLLPLPGSALVRAQAIRKLGGKTSRALVSTAATGVAWIAVAGFVAGISLLGRAVVLGLACSAVSIVLGAASFVVVRRQVDAARAPALMYRLVVAEAGSVAVKTGRLYLVIRAIGYDVAIDQALALTLAAVVAVAMGFFPGGLGASEILSAVVAPAVDLPAAVGVTASAIDRLLTLVGLAVITAVVWMKKQQLGREERDMAHDIPPPPEAPL